MQSESRDVTVENSAVDSAKPAECHETVDPETRSDVLAKYDHRCQGCGRCGPQEGGLATLHVHHIERDPDGMEEHDLENLSLLCRSCHSWLHHQSTPDDSPVEITEADQSVLLPHDIEILRYLATNGPARTGDIVTGLTADLSVSAVRERLWVLMGLDNRVESRDKQVVDKDVETGEWGLTEQVETSARGYFPDDQQLLLQRMEDEQVRQALERGCDRSDVADVLGMSRRTTFHKTKRALAFDFPLDAFSRGGRPSLRDEEDLDADAHESASDSVEGQQRLDVVADGGDEDDTPDTEHTVGSGTPGYDGADGESQTSGEQQALREQLETAITALQEINAAL